MTAIRLASKLAPLETLLTHLLTSKEVEAVSLGSAWAKKIDSTLGSSSDPTEWEQATLHILKIDHPFSEEQDAWRVYPSRVLIKTTYRLPTKLLLHKTARDVGVRSELNPKDLADPSLLQEIGKILAEDFRPELTKKSFWEETIEQGHLDTTLNKESLGFEPSEWRVLSLAKTHLHTSIQKDEVFVHLEAEVSLREPEDLTPDEPETFQNPTLSRVAKAAVVPVRQKTQYSCVVASLAMALASLGFDCDEGSVNQMVGAIPGHGASWDQAIAAAQYFGARATLVCPCTIEQIKSWTDRGLPVLIGWCPEGRPWGHASCVFDVLEDGTVLVADPNIPDPAETVRKVPRAEFYKKWYEPGDKFLTRRTALMLERDIP